VKLSIVHGRFVANASSIVNAKFKALGSNWRKATDASNNEHYPVSHQCINPRYDRE
jgi:hypothetical protein